MKPEDRPRRGDQIVWRNGDEGVVILNPSDGQYFALDEIGGRIWELCEGDRSVLEIAETVAGEYDATAATIEADALELLEELSDEGLLHVG